MISPVAVGGMARSHGLDHPLDECYFLIGQMIFGIELLVYL